MRDGNTGCVPSVVDPDVDLPDDVAAAIAVCGTALRVAILRTLASGSMTTVQLVDELDVAARSTMPRNMALLEDLGAIRGEPPLGHRTGRTVRWHLERERVRALTGALSQYLGM